MIGANLSPNAGLATGSPRIEPQLTGGGPTTRNEGGKYWSAIAGAAEGESC